MGLFKKKKKGSVEIKLAADQFCRILEDKAEDCSHTYCIDTDADQYNLLYRNGQFKGMPTPYGGTIYPFSVDPTKPGSRSEKKQFNRTKVVCLSKDSNLKVTWGTKMGMGIHSLQKEVEFAWIWLLVDLRINCPLSLDHY